MRRTALFASLPNLITLGRLVLVPLIVAMISSSRWREAFLIFVIAGVSDGVDGFLARRFDLRSELGSYLDPLADKALLVSIYVTLAVREALPPWIAIIVVSRDLMIMGAVVISWLLDKPVAIRPLTVSKLNTAAQIAFAAFVLAAKAFGWPADDAIWMAMYVVAGLTTLSAGAYFTQWFAHMTREPTAP